MKRILVVVVAAFSLLCIAPGALMLSAADEPPQIQAMDWTRFSPADRASCLSMTGAGGTYTGLLKCLEIKRDASLAKKPATVGKGR